MRLATSFAWLVLARFPPLSEMSGWLASSRSWLLATLLNPLRPVEHLLSEQGDPNKARLRNGTDALLTRAEQVLAFLDDLRIPFTHNQAERDLRMAKVQQKIAGTFRSAEGATAFCVIRSYLSTMRKQGRSMLAAMAAVFAGSPFPVAWGSE
jgi:transposase